MHARSKGYAYENTSLKFKRGMISGLARRVSYNGNVAYD